MFYLTSRIALILKLYANFSGKPLHNFFIYIKFQLKNVIFILLPDKAKASARGWLPGQVVGLLSSGRGGYFLSQAEEPDDVYLGPSLLPSILPALKVSSASVKEPKDVDLGPGLLPSSLPALKVSSASAAEPEDVYLGPGLLPSSLLPVLRSRLFSEAETDML